jgi:hypothetical protein
LDGNGELITCSSEKGRLAVCAELCEKLCEELCAKLCAELCAQARNGEQHSDKMQTHVKPDRVRFPIAAEYVKPGEIDNWHR